MQTNKKQTTAQAAYKRERDERLTFAATHPAGEVLQELHTTLIGLEESEVEAYHEREGCKKVTRL